ncbi:MULTISPECIES: alpha/beta fold hydrolase [unclassified Lysobacter]|uniref:esterase/lipase family protein n=1 Tax=unclassified Lysobacter TaxID=2635362 RepID=UPI001BE8241D|nr:MULTISPECIES: alpha/beta fold hydrolase [unclassified Lysobacter]MBT2748762.1 alpha/beta fold hydrolase [Lysobacter sp. ISL-42]MBT2751697.1 alpha/beta fold hydrolase [Lysobacter sp. ISL-50]MBT2775891.1 alpha/beta fold hydrolase [Lysobacter sp. ISL-54]MBT2782145.1 alpha/beta fold hydrolase [Lysobacter sp. ISL-52]
MKFRLVAAIVVLFSSVLALQPAAAANRGLNDWNCQPSAAHPEPVVLVHGLGANQYVNWAYMGPNIAAAGHCAFTVSYGEGAFWIPGIRPMADSAVQLSDFVDRVLAATGAQKVNIVGHSEGTTVPAYYIKYAGGDQKVKQMIGFAPNYKGTTLYGLNQLVHGLTSIAPYLGTAFYDGVCAACLEYLPPSAFLDELNLGGSAAVPGVQYTNIATRYDHTVIPYTSGFMGVANARDVVLQDECGADFSSHIGMAISPNVLNRVLNALDPQVPKTCVPYWPLGL